MVSSLVGALCVALVEGGLTSPFSNTDATFEVLVDRQCWLDNVFFHNSQGRVLQRVLRLFHPLYLCSHSCVGNFSSVLALAALGLFIMYSLRH